MLRAFVPILSVTLLHIPEVINRDSKAKNYHTRDGS